MSINVEATCPTHGTGVEIFTLAGKRFCALCVAAYLAEHCSQIQMVTVETVQPKAPVVEWEHHYICPACQHTWKADKGAACPKCGTDAKNPELRKEAK